MMNQIDLSGEKVKLKVGEKFYSEEALRNTISAFNKNFQVEERKPDGISSDYQEIVIDVSNEDVNKKDVALEFFNYLLSEEKKKISLTSLI